MKFLVETDNDGIATMVRAHRKFFGAVPKKLKCDVVEIECTSDDPSLYFLEPEADEVVEGPTAKLESGAFVTMNEQQYGDPSARLASGKKAPVKLNWGEWTVVATAD